jgi:hypothetical protein
MDEEKPASKAVYKPYVPRSTYAKPFTPAVKWQGGSFNW